MKEIKIFTLVLAGLFILSGCGTQKRAAKKAEQLRDESKTVSQDGGDNVKGKKILYPAGHDQTGDYYSDADEPLGPVGRKRLPGDRPQITFTPLESSNVRVPGINPLPENGTLELDLDKMNANFCYPYNGEFLSGYGVRGRAMHTGIDIRTIPGDTIRAAFPGVVRMSKMYSSYGNIVVIRHYEGFETVYAHSSRNLVGVNDVVEAGAPVGLGGRTGRASTEHLHFEVRVAGEHVDPSKLLDAGSRSLRKGKMFISKVDNNIVAYSSPADLRDTQEERKSADAAREESEMKAAENRAAVVAQAEKTSEAAREFYKVQKGDTLYSIALRHKTTVKKLCDLNGISENSVLQINQRLRVK